jgi:predicted AlkP superfamily pyrophosphatase or phosphodiesterase
MDTNRRDNLDTDAAGDYDEENAVCYLQILLADDIPEMGSSRMTQDMDSWGYTFRLGSAQAWFNQDADDALDWLKNYKLLDTNNRPNYQLRT